MSWRESLVRISTYEVEVLQRRLADVADRRVAASGRADALECEVAVEIAGAEADPSARAALGPYLAGVRRRRERLGEEIRALELEESGARDALADAFEALKKFEQVAEWARLEAVREEGRRDARALDELGLRGRRHG